MQDPAALATHRAAMAADALDRFSWRQVITRLQPDLLGIARGSQRRPLTAAQVYCFCAFCCVYLLQVP